MATWARNEPLVLFLALGALLFGAWTLIMPQKVGTVMIDPEALRALEKQEQDLRGRPLTDEERAVLREGYIDDEVLLREALRRGLQFSDYRSRQRLVRIMRGALTEFVPDPSIAQLQAYYRENIDMYTRDRAVTFEQVAFPWGSEVGSEKLEAILSQLKAGATVDQFPGSPMTLGPRVREATRAYLVSSCGPEFADAIEGLPLDEWEGPVESILGIHLVRVMERHPSRVASFEDVEGYLRQDWLMTRTREAQQKRIDEIRDTYRIEVPEP